MQNTKLPVFITYLFVSLLLLASCTDLNQSSTWNTRQTQANNQSTDYGTQQGNVYSDNQFVNVALLLPLTGQHAALGQSMLQSAQLALFETNNPSLNLIPLDTQGTANGAKNAAQEAINSRAQLILGPVFSQSVSAVKPIAQSHNINVIAFSTDQSLADSSTFLMGFMPSTQAQEIANYAARNGYRKISIVAPRDVYGNIVTSTFESAVRTNGGIVKEIVRYTPSDPNLGTRIAAMSADTNAVFIPASENDARAIGNYLDQNNMSASRVKRLGTGLWDNPQIAKISTLQGGLFANPSPQKYGFFKNKYEDAYGTEPARIASLSFDATALAATLIQNSAGQRNSQPFARKHITDRNGYAGADGVFRFAPSGIVQRKLSILELRNGSIIEVIPASKQF